MNTVLVSSTIVLTVAAALGIGIAASYVAIYSLLNVMRPARVPATKVALKAAEAQSASRVS